MPRLRSCAARALLLTTALGLGPGCGDSVQGAAPPSVILVCIDTLRADHLGCYGYQARDTSPFLDELAGRSTLFEHATATACWTKPSVPSILTGALPLQHGVYRGSARDEAGTISDVLPPEARTLAEEFSERGYRTAAFVRNSQLRAGMGFEQGFEVYRDRAGDAREIRWRAQDWLDQGEAGEPFFLYLHFLDAHWPYDVPDDYAGRYTDPESAARVRAGDWRALRDAVNDGERTLSAEELGALVATYDGAIRYVDDQLALLWERLEREGLAEDTILCVVSDHGEEFLEHGKLGHGHGLYENLLSVPWILHVPGRAAASVAARVSLVDLYPTLLAAAGLGGARPPLAGRDRLREAEAEGPVLSEHLDPRRYHVAWTRGEAKTVEVLEPAVGARAALTLETLPAGGRWEVRLDPARPAARRALRLRPSDDPDEDELELKGPLEELTNTGFRVAGVSVVSDAATELYGATVDDAGEPRALAEGLLVKVKGAARDGELVARKVKLYPAGDELEVELRGPLSRGPNGELLVGGFALTLDERCELDLDQDHPDLGSEAVVELLEGRATVLAREVRAFDLAADPGELAPREGASLLEDPARSRLFQRLLERRFASDEVRRLNAEEVGDLHALGYTE